MTYTLNLGNTEALDQFDNVSYMAFGDGNTTPAVGDITMENELLRVAIPSENITKDTGNNTYTYTGRIPITQLNSSTIREVGLFEQSSGGTMAVRILSPVEVTKTSDDEILYTLRVKTNTKNN